MICVLLFAFRLGSIAAAPPSFTPCRAIAGSQPRFLPGAQPWVRKVLFIVLPATRQPALPSRVNKTPSRKRRPLLSRTPSLSPHTSQLTYQPTLLSPRLSRPVAGPNSRARCLRVFWEPSRGLDRLTRAAIDIVEIATTTTTAVPNPHHTLTIVNRLAIILLPRSTSPHEVTIVTRTGIRAQDGPRDGMRTMTMAHVLSLLLAR